MGLDKNGIKCLLYAKSLKVDFSKTAMIGRQCLHLSPSDLKKDLREFGYHVDKNLISALFQESNGYAESLIKYLGGETSDSFDMSDYEGATHIHDMNQELPEHFRKRYSVVIDGGSLEHIFNFPVAIRNCMEMLVAGGHYLGIVPANNFMGHGFYQFSPDLFFSIFTGENGFQLVKMIIFENRENAICFSVKDPKMVKRRITLINNNPTYLFVIAKKISESATSEITSFQSDYLSLWSDNSVIRSEIPNTQIMPDLLNLCRKHLPLRILNMIRWLRSQLTPTFNPIFYEPIELRVGIKSSATNENIEES